jgi:uncharacterized protein (DUF2132 family)
MQPEPTLAPQAPEHPDRQQPNNPLHGKTLEMILQQLVDRLSWAELGRRITIRCFTDTPSISSSLKFLRKTPWARKKVERLYLETSQGLPPAPRPSGKSGSRKKPRRKAKP